MWDLWSSVRFPVGFCGISCEISCGVFCYISCGILWEFSQKSCGNGMGVGIEIPFPRQPWVIVSLRSAQIPSGRFYPDKRGSTVFY